MFITLPDKVSKSESSKRIQSFHELLSTKSNEARTSIDKVGCCIRYSQRIASQQNNFRLQSLSSVESEKQRKVACNYM